jgi:uncharacterized membrane protein
MARVYYVGDWAVLTGPVFAETPFHYSHKGLDIFNYGHWLKTALEATGEHQVASVPSWDFYNRLGPGDYEQVLAEHDVLVFSDVDAKLFQLAPTFFDRKQFGKQPLTYPDRIRLTLEAVRAGKGLMLLGGWYSFTGELGKGGWGRTPLAEVLPVRCLEVEDLVESTEGFSPEATAAGRRFFRGLDLVSMPPLLGYNKTRRRAGSSVLLEVAETGDPLLAVRPYGKGRVLAYTSDPAPHWGLNFVYWDGYGEFWRRCLAEVAGRTPTRSSARRTAAKTVSSTASVKGPGRP